MRLKRKLVIIAIAAAAVIGLAFAIGPQIYAAMQPAAPAPLSVASSSQSPATPSSSGAASSAGSATRERSSFSST